jgi:hypothetical protein
MAIITWPESLPQLCETGGYQEVFPDGRMFSSTDTGPAKVRLRSSAAPSLITATMIMVPEDLLALRAFIHNDLGGGVLNFQWAGDGGEARLVRFAQDGLPTIAPIAGGRWSVQYKLEVMP